MSPAELRQLTEELYRKAHDPTFPRSDEYRRCAQRFRDAVDGMFTPLAGGKEPVLNRDTLEMLYTHIYGMRKALWKGADRDDLHLFLDLKNDEEKLDGIVNTLSQADAAKGKTLTEALNDLTLLNVAPLETAPVLGDNSSKRELYQAQTADGKKINGFYTKEERLFSAGNDGVYADFIRERMQQEPEDRELQQFCQKVLDSDYGAASLIFCMYPGLRLPRRAAGSDVDTRKAYNAKKLAAFGFIDQPSHDSYLNIASVTELLEDFRAFVSYDDANKIHNRFFQYGIGNHAISADKDGIVAGRNAAMSRMANLFGIPELVARSVVMVKTDGYERETGVFMEEAKGNGVPNNPAGFQKSVFAHMDPYSFRTPALKMAGDLQILDYLCMNVDRHSGNMLYTFDKNIRLTGIMGIDNDLSFGRRRQKDNECVQNGTALDNLFVISESMVKSVKRTSPEMIRAALDGTGLQPSEITACCSRLARLQKRIELSERTPIPANRDKMAGVLRIVSDDEWEDLSTSMFLPNDPGQHNVFSMLSEVEELAAKYPAKANAPIERKPLSYANTEYHDLLAPDLQIEVLDDIRRFRDEFAQTEGFFHGSHDEYKTMKTALDTLLKTEIDEDRPMREEERTAYLVKLDTVFDSVNAYIEHKTAEHDTGKTGTERLRVAKAVSEYLGQHIPSFREAALEREEREFSELFLEARRQEEQYDAVHEALRRKLSENVPGLPEAEILERLKTSSAPGGALDALLSSDETALSRCAALAKSDPDALYRQYSACLAAKYAEHADKSAADKSAADKSAEKENPAVRKKADEAEKDRAVEGLRVVQ